MLLIYEIIPGFGRDSYPEILIPDPPALSFSSRLVQRPDRIRAAGRNTPDPKKGYEPMTLTGLNIDLNRLAEICRRYRVRRLEVIGSFARGDEGSQSDIDMLVTFEPQARIGLEFVALKQELEALTGRQIDLLTRNSVERSPNKYFRRFALRRTEPLYEPS